MRNICSFPSLEQDAPSLEQKHPVGFFDGAALNGDCGAGLVIKIGKDKIIKGWLKAGKGSNTRAKVAVLWSLLFVRNFGVFMLYKSWEIPKSLLIGKMGRLK